MALVMQETNPNHSEQRCGVCCLIPPDFLVNTGRGEYFPAEVGQLLRLDLSTSNDVFRCPACSALFEWAHLPQSYGSNNNAQQRLTRLNPEQAHIVNVLLGPDFGAYKGEQLLQQAFRILSPDLVYNLLYHSAHRYKQAFSRLLGPLVGYLIQESNDTLFNVISLYCGSDRERLAEVLGLLEMGASLSVSAHYLLEQCAERLEDARG